MQLYKYDDFSYPDSKGEDDAFRKSLNLDDASLSFLYIYLFAVSKFQVVLFVVRKCNFLAS